VRHSERTSEANGGLVTVVVLVRKNANAPGLEDKARVLCDFSLYPPQDKAAKNMPMGYHDNV
jgi:hypothetical protein